MFSFYLQINVFNIYALTASQQFIFFIIMTFSFCHVVVCLSVTLVRPAKAVTWNKMPFGQNFLIGLFRVNLS